MLSLHDVALYEKSFERYLNHVKSEKQNTTNAFVMDERKK
jgi:hypothetical protein